MVYQEKKRYALIKFITPLLDLLIPRICDSCNIKLELNETAICNKCLSSIKRVDINKHNYEFKKNFKYKNSISDFESLYLFEKDKSIQHIIHAIKYKNKFRTAFFFGGLIGSFFQDKIRSWNIDLIIPVPLHKAKKTERGFNQSFYIAKGLSKYLNIPSPSNTLIRKRYTDTQTAMTIEQREQNVMDAFIVKKKELILKKRILLVDDVITTGSTLNECGRVLKIAGSGKIAAVSLALAE
jgi:ComF family protein